MGWLAIIGAILADIPIIDKWLGMLRKLWQKSPVDEQAKQNQKDDEALKNAEQKDDTSGLFGK